VRGFGPQARLLQLLCSRVRGEGFWASSTIVATFVLACEG